jgi:hypothetical protein
MIAQSRIECPLWVKSRLFASVDGKEDSNEIEKTMGFMEAHIVDGLLMLTTTSEVRENPFYFQAVFTQIGQFKRIKSMELDGKDLMSSGSPELKGLLKAMEDASRSSSNVYDKVIGYETGDLIYNAEVNMNFLGYEMSVKPHGVVRGLTVYEEREALVVDLDGTISVNGNSGSSSGYLILDIATGFPVLAESLGSVSIPLMSVVI